MSIVDPKKRKRRYPPEMEAEAAGIYDDGPTHASPKLVRKSMIVLWKYIPERKRKPVPGVKVQEVPDEPEPKSSPPPRNTNDSSLLEVQEASANARKKKRRTVDKSFPSDVPAGEVLDQGPQHQAPKFEVPVTEEESRAPSVVSDYGSSITGGRESRVSSATSVSDSQRSTMNVPPGARDGTRKKHSGLQYNKPRFSVAPGDV
jgi:hypothetical protein